MSWLSKITHTEGATPDFIKKIGDAAGGLVVNAIPGGASLDSVLNLTNTGPKKGPTLEEIVAATQSNVNRSLDNASQFASVQGQGQSLVAAITSPVGLLVVGVGAYLLLRKK